MKYPADLVVASNHGIEFAAFGALVQVNRVLFERLVAAFGGCGLGFFSLAQLGNDGAEFFFAEPCIPQSLAHGVASGSDPQDEELKADVVVAKFFGCSCRLGKGILCGAAEVAFSAVDPTLLGEEGFGGVHQGFWGKSRSAQ